MVKIFSYQLFKKLNAQLSTYFNEEAAPLSFLITEHFSGLSKTQILIDTPFSAGPQFESNINTIINRLKQNEPIQYILGKAYFYDRPFTVNNSTLIPRQETEELVHLILQDINKEDNLSILDIGTGTGCIPITLALESNSHTFDGVDISKIALETAIKNASNLSADVNFYTLDILKKSVLKPNDVIISNPPYVLESEKGVMKENVLKYEPHQALFVEDSDPLLFYTKITQLASESLNNNGRLYFEINEQFGKEVINLLKSHSFKEVNLHQDLNGKDRFVSGCLG